MIRLATRSDAHLLRDYIQWQITYGGWLPATVRVRRSQLQRFIAHLEERGQSLITASKDDIESWVAEVEAGIIAKARMSGRPAKASADAIANLVSGVTGLYAYLIDQLELRDDDPTRKIRRPRIRPRPPRPMPDHVAKSALRIAAGTPTLFPMLVLVFCAGLRVSDLAGLRKADVEPGRKGWGVLWIEHGKGDKRRRLELPRDVFDVIAPLVIGSGPLFSSPRGGHYTANSVSKVLNAFLRDDVRTDFRIHSGRGLFATDATAEGMGVFSLQQLLGHADPKTTAGYTQTLPKHARKPLKRVAKKRLGNVIELRRRSAP